MAKKCSRVSWMERERGKKKKKRKRRKWRKKDGKGWRGRRRTGNEVENEERGRRKGKVDLVRR